MIFLLSLPATAEAPNAEAKLHAQKAFAAYGLHRFDEAAKEYELAFELKPDPALLFNAAQAHRNADHKARALELYEGYLRLYPKMKNESEVRQVIEKLRVAIANDERTRSGPPQDLKTEDRPEKPEAAHAPPPVAAPAPAPPTGATTENRGGQLVAAAPERKPVYKKGWFWGAVAGGVVVVGGAVVLGVLLGSPAKAPVASGGIAYGN